MKKPVANRVAQKQWQRSILFALLALVLFPALASAATFSLDIRAIENEIMSNESASYEITATNFQASPLKFQVYTVDPSWNIKTVPITPTIPANGQERFILYLRPAGSAGSGTQGVSVTFKDLTSGTLIKKDFVLSLRQQGIPPKGYEPTVLIDARMPYDVDPRTALPLRLEIRNRNALNLQDIRIEVSSPHVSANTTVTLAPLSDKTVDITGLTMDSLSSPIEADLLIRLLYNGEVIAQLVKNYRIKEYTTVSQELEEEKFFFKTTKTVIVTNNGNVKNVALVSVPTSLVKSLFVSSSLPYERAVQDEQRVLLWSIPLGPDEQKEFVYTENYRILILLALAAALALLGYVLLRSPIVVIKEAVGVAKHDGVSQVKIRIFIKNRSARLIQHIQVTDRLPSLADVLKTEALGSITPAKVAVSEKGGTLLRWELETLEPYEERVLTYQAKSKLKIIGRMSLPKAKVRFSASGKERVVYSDNVEIVERFKDR